MSKLSFKKPRTPKYRKAAILTLPLFALMLATGLTWSELRSNAQHLYRWPFSEVGNYLAGARYQVNLNCKAQPRARRHTLRAADFEDARGYLQSELPGCQLAEIRRVDRSWY